MKSRVRASKMGGLAMLGGCAFLMMASAAAVMGAAAPGAAATTAVATGATVTSQPTSADHKGREKLSNLIDAVIVHGPGSRLPAHLSMVLGVSATERETPVKQAVMRHGDVVRTFNVCVTSHRDVVLISYNERTHVSNAYLVSPAGRLRKAVTFQAGETAIQRSPSEARADVGSEVDFWADLAHEPPPALRPGPAGRPGGQQP